jgi:hypothetical protein
MNNNTEIETKTLISKNGNIYNFIPNFEQVNNLPLGNYRLDYNLRTGFYLTKLDDKTPETTVYSTDKDFINHVVFTVNKTTEKNTGILLTGKKGLGKSFTAKQLCERLQLPTIMIDSAYDQEMFHFLNTIHIPHIIYIDEFEKLYPEKGEGNKMSQEKFLSYLDGGMSNNIKKVFIITTNSRVNDLFLNRPSRLKYIRKYEKIADEVIQEIIDDLLINKSYASDLIDNLNGDNLNVDILIKIIEEINLVDKPYSSFKDFFNFEVEVIKYKLDIVLNEDDEITVGNPHWTEKGLKNIIKPGAKLFLDCYKEIDEDYEIDEGYTIVKQVLGTKQGNIYLKVDVPCSYTNKKYNSLTDEEKNKYDNNNAPIYRSYTLKISRNYVKYIY